MYNATHESIGSYMFYKDLSQLNILTFTTHERYEQGLCETGHNFYALDIGGKNWDAEYGEIPSNYHQIKFIPSTLKIDLILAQHQSHMPAAMEISKNYGAPVILLTHILPQPNQDENLQVFGWSDSNVFISNYSKGKWAVDPRAKVIEHGIDVDFWGERHDDVVYDDVVYGDNYVLSVVNEFPTRDWCCGFNLWRTISENVPCGVVGKCTSHPDFSKAAESKEHLRSIYRNASAFLNTSLVSPVPTSMLEAMACGLPVVSTDNCMIPEIIEHGVNGYLSNDPQELISFCNELLSDSEKAANMGAKAMETVRKCFNMERFVSDWNLHFKEVITKK